MDKDPAAKSKAASPASDAIMSVDLDHRPIYESGAQLLTTLCFSESQDDDSIRGRAHASLCSWAIRERAARDAEWNWALQSMRPYYAAWPEKIANGDIRRINTRMKARMIAARMVLPLLKQAEMPPSADIPKSLERLSVNRLAGGLAAASGMEGAENIKHRAWVPSRNVLHLAAAFEFTRYVFLKAAQYEVSYWDYLWKRDVIAFVLERAEAFEPLALAAAKQHRFALDPASLIRLRPVEPGSK